MQNNKSAFFCVKNIFFLITFENYSGTLPLDAIFKYNMNGYPLYIKIKQIHLPTSLTDEELASAQEQYNAYFESDKNSGVTEKAEITRIVAE